MFVIFTIGLVLTVCVMRTGAEGCVKCCEGNENESFGAAIGLHKIIGLHTTAEKAETKFDALTTFTARRSTSWSMLKKGEYVGFDMVDTNAGNNFKSELGIYIAPAKGIYFFYLEATSANMFELEIFHNDSEVGTVDQNKHSTIVIREMAEKDVLYVKVKEAQDNGTLVSSKIGGFMILG